MIASGARIEADLERMIVNICSNFRRKLAFFKREDIARSYPTYAKEVHGASEHGDEFVESWSLHFLQQCSISTS